MKLYELKQSANTLRTISTFVPLVHYTAIRDDRSFAQPMINRSCCMIGR